MTLFTLKTLQIIGSFMVFGSLMISPFWRFMAERVADPCIIRFAHRQMIRCEYFFVFPGTLLVVVPFYIALLEGSPIRLTDPLSYVGKLCFTLSALLWVFGIRPALGQLSKITRDFNEDSIIGPDYFFWMRRWKRVGIPATFLLLFAIYILVFRPLLQG